MKKKGKARPRKYIMYDFGTLYKCYIHCYPQQIWTYEINEEKDRVYLCNEKKQITIEITILDFKAHWIILLFMTFDNLVEKLENKKHTLEEIIKMYNDLYDTGYKISCWKNEVVADEELDKFFDKLGAEITEYNYGYALIETVNGTAYEVPYEEKDEKTILNFAADKIYDISENLGNKVI